MIDEFEIIQTPFSEAIEAINEGCEEIDLSNKQINNENIDVLCNILKGNNTLKSINLSGNEITSKGMTSIKNLLLDKNFTLLTINLENQKEKKIMGKFFAKAKNMTRGNETRHELLSNIEILLERNKIRGTTNYESIENLSQEEKKQLLEKSLKFIKINKKNPENKLRRQKYRKGDNDGQIHGFDDVTIGLSHSLMKLVDNNGKATWYIVEIPSLGNGANGKVKKAYPIEENHNGAYFLGAPCVIKIIKPIRPIDIQTEMEIFNAEVRMTEEAYKDFSVRKLAGEYNSLSKNLALPRFCMTLPLGGLTICQHIMNGYFQYMPFEERLDIINQLWEKLSLIHEKKIVHRDIKSENILFDPAKKHIQIIDYGSSIKVEFNHKEPVPLEGFTPYYLAPEVLHDAPPKHNELGKQQWATHSQDVFALGVVTLEILSSSPQDPKYGKDDYYIKNPIFSEKVRYERDYEDIVHIPYVYEQSSLSHSIVSDEDEWYQKKECFFNYLNCILNIKNENGIRLSAKKVHEFFSIQQKNIIDSLQTSKEEQHLIGKLEKYYEQVKGLEHFIQKLQKLQENQKPREQNALNNHDRISAARLEVARQVQKLNIAIMKTLCLILQSDPDNPLKKIRNETQEKGALSEDAFDKIMESAFNYKLLQIDGDIEPFTSSDTSNSEVVAKHQIINYFNDFKNAISPKEEGLENESANNNIIINI